MVYIKRLVWDSWNVEHIARHDVTSDEVEEVCHCNPVFRDSYKGRKLVIGPTKLGRMITVALDPEPEMEGVFYPVTAHPASRKERRRYKETKEVDQNEKTKKQ
ncbi:BrnT family toxin [Candidatus Daviesbacteria bacterium]|nr:BrnT family toxin [Candidatus Daviesbacteria bacterium]